MFRGPRCGAKTRRGTPCQRPAILKSGRCRLHGGRSPGAPKGNKYNLKHGLYSADAIAHRRKVGALLRAARKLMKQVDEGSGLLVCQAKEGTEGCFS
jgi:hypothetical protein